jgi:hypothetical protein
MSGDFDLEDLLAKLPLQSKIKLLAGDVGTGFVMFTSSR